MSSRDRGARSAVPITHVPVPKPSGGTRSIAVLDSEDHAAYERAVSRLAGVIERALGPRVVANRLLPAPGVRLEPFRRARRRLHRAREAMRHAAAALRTDVRDCYGSISPAVVESSLLRLGGGPDDLTSIRRILEDFETRGVKGLPVGPDPSAALANAVLTVADRCLEVHGLVHVRWVDDIWAAAPSTAAAERALDRLRHSLDRVGLRVAEEKTAIIDPATISKGGMSSPASAI